MHNFKLLSDLTRTSGLTKLENGRLHAVRYIWEEGLTIKELADKGIVRLKSGISQRLNKKEYLSELIRGDSTGKKIIWWDDDFIDQSLTYEQASEVIAKMDKIFNTMMRDNGYQSRQIHRTKRISTENFESDDKQSLIDTVKYTWNLAYQLAYSFVTKTEAPGAVAIQPFTHRPLQDTLITTPSIEGFRELDQMTWEIPGGAGKSKCSMYTSHEVLKELGLPWKVLGIAPDRAMAAQLCDEFSKFYRGQKGERLMNLYIIGSLDSSDWRAISAWASVIQVSNKIELEKMLIDVTSSNEDCGIFVVNKSVGDFLSTAKSIGVNFKEFFTIIDEIHNYVKEFGKPTTVNSPRCAIYNPTYKGLFNKRLGLSATHINRDETLIPFIERPDAIFNDDLDKNGPCKVRIPETEARLYGWICDKQGVLIEVPTDQVFVDALVNKDSFVFEVEGNPFKFHPVTFVGVEGIRKLAPTHNKIIALCSYRADISEICRLLKEYQSAGLLDNDFIILEGYVENSTQLIAKFNEQGKRVILVATRWIGVGNDTYTCDCTIPLYNPKSRAYARQFGMRGDRVDGDKITTFAMVIHQDQLEDSPFYETFQMISNGGELQILSEAEFRQNRRRTTGGRVTGNITMVQSERTNRETSNEVSVILQEIMSLVAKREYVDEATGKTRFSEIAGFNETNYTYEMILEFVKIKNYLSLAEWSDCLEGIRYHAAAYKKGWHLDICEELGLKYSKEFNVELFKEFLQKYNITSNTTKKEFDEYAKQDNCTSLRKIAIREGWMLKDFLCNAKPGFDVHDKPTIDMVIKWILDNQLQGIGRAKARKYDIKKDKSGLNIGALKMVAAYCEFVNAGKMDDLLGKSGRDTGRKINAIDKEGNIIATFSKIKEASLKLNINAASISNVLGNKAKTAGGYFFQYVDENNFKLNK